MPRFRQLALAAASKYAPKPNGSAWTYGLISAMLLGVAVALVGGFYGIDLTPHATLLGGGLAAAFALGVVIRKVRSRSHNKAFAAEDAKARAAGI